MSWALGVGCGVLACRSRKYWVGVSLDITCTAEIVVDRQPNVMARGKGRLSVACRGKEYYACCKEGERRVDRQRDVRGEGRLTCGLPARAEAPDIGVVGRDAVYRVRNVLIADTLALQEAGGHIARLVRVDVLRGVG